MKWYHDWREKARNRYLEGYYPGHKRVPNSIVLSLYGIGYFISDFVPLILNFINGVYWAIKRLVAFVVGLLVEASIFVVLAGSVIFSVAHSLVQMRKVGATGGLEYVGVLMFEVIFIGSAATLTGFLMKKKIPRGFIEWMGLVFTIVGFLVGLSFVWWANYHGMKPTLEGRIIGSAVPLLVLIGEGILAYRFIEQAELENLTHKKSHTEENLSQRSSQTFAHTPEETVSGSHTSNSERENSLPLTEENFSHEILTPEEFSQSNREEISSQNKESQTDEATEKVSQEKPSHSVEVKEQAKSDDEQFSQADDTHTEEEVSNLSQQEEVSQPEESSQEEEKSSQKDALTVENSHTSQEENSHTEVDSHTSQKETHTQKTSHKKSSSQTKKYTLRKKSHNKSSQSDQELLTDLEEIKKVALRMFAEKGGTYPSIRELKDEAPCSEWLSRKALNQLNPKKKKAN
ncbi:MFS transporter [Thermoactinomyces daqus]|uniref:MFS transporter n=1 Tax=Thermoactinomyces daqus TaxID=1329516 RepID=A0A7W1XDH1_9BACL|nr:MFS transporter [Thermoactinomyces daqus]MBA4544593.1 MFS transporter [Thermoactinomyces daqus]